MAKAEVLVRVNDSIAKYGGVFTDRDQPSESRVIGKDPLKVQLTAQVGHWLATGQLIIVEEAPSTPPPPPPPPPSGWPSGLRLDIVELLEKSGVTPIALANMSDKEIAAIPGIGPSKLEAIRKYFPI